MEKKVNVVSNHSIQIKNKEHIEVLGVLEVFSSTDKEIVMKLDNDILYIFGSGLSIQKLSPEERVLFASGKVEGIKYAARVSKKNFLQKVFK